MHSDSDTVNIGLLELLLAFLGAEEPGVGRGTPGVSDESASIVLWLQS
jgi:hypothetical protein